MPHNDENWLNGKIEHIKRTEQEILKDFEKLGWKVTQNDDSFIIICFDDFARIIIIKCTKTYSVGNLCNIQEHKLLNELFTVWGWLKEDKSE